MKVLFVVPYPSDLSPSQRFRFEQYHRVLQSHGYQYEIHSFLLPHNWRLFTQAGKFMAKTIAVVTGYARRIILLGRVQRFDWVFIHREAAPLGPPFFEWAIARVLRKKLIYDFDDAIWLTDRTQEPAVARALRWRTKVSTICGMSYRVSCGNAFLAAYARNFNNNVLINPTTIDTNWHRPGNETDKGGRSIIIGWTGTLSTLKYLSSLEKVVATIVARHPRVQFFIIADKPPAFTWPSTQYLAWKKETEIADLQKFDIGIMPLPNDDWSKGKCGFKALQYMALGIPTVASPVGVSTEIISHGQNGLLASSDAEWLSCLEELIRNKELRQSLGAAGEQTVRERYSVHSNEQRFLSLFN